MDISETNVSTAISVVYPQSPRHPPACRLWLKAPALNLCENTLLLHVQCVWVPLSLISAIERVCRQGKPSKPLSVPGNCNRSKLSQHAHGPHPPSTAQLGWKQGFVLLAFSEHCHHCSNQSSHNELGIPSLARHCCTVGSKPQQSLYISCWQPGWSTLINSITIPCTGDRGAGDRLMGKYHRA